jgi:hypothetical protein
VVTPLSGADNSKIAHRGEAAPEAFRRRFRDRASNLLGVFDFESI